jgi:hypothetical protein
MFNCNLLRYPSNKTLFFLAKCDLKEPFIFKNGDKDYQITANWERSMLTRWKTGRISRNGRLENEEVFIWSEQLREEKDGRIFKHFVHRYFFIPKGFKPVIAAGKHRYDFSYNRVKASLETVPYHCFMDVSETDLTGELKISTN